LVTLGELRLLGPAGEILPGRTKLLVLLAYVARRSPRAVSREELAALLWGEKDEFRARQSLRHALLELRRAVGEGLEVTPKAVRLAPGAVELDASAFERDVEQCNPRGAAARWGGEFLHAADGGVAEGCRVWIERERQLLRGLLGSAFERLSDEAAAQGASDEAVAWAERLSEALPFDEQAHTRLIQALVGDDRAAEALARNGAFVARMRDEAGLEPLVVRNSTSRVTEQ
jgi:DNA-binding SARP family transcriptional activator